MLHDAVVQTALVAGGVVTIGGAIGYTWKRVIRPLAHLLVTIEETIPIVNDIRAEFRNDGGKSLKDAIDRIEHDGSNTRQALVTHTEWSEAQALKLENSLVRLSNLSTRVDDLVNLVNVFIGLGTLQPPTPKDPGAAPAEP